MTATIAMETAEPMAFIGGPNAGRIDAENRLIRGVKVCGLVSGNSARVIGFPDDRPYRYDEAGLKKAVSLYEGVRVYCDHPPSSIGPDGSRKISKGNRSLGDTFGKLVNARFVLGEGIYADLNYLESHPLCGMILEAAEWSPELIALSHNTPVVLCDKTGDGVVIREIVEVRSVDLIGEKPGTTRSLFESEEKTMPGTQVTTETQKADPLLPEETMVETPAEPETPDPAKSIRQGFVDGIIAVVEDESMSIADMKKRLDELLDGMETAGNSVSGGSEPAEETPKKTETAESLSRLNAENRLLRAGVAKPTQTMIGAVARADNEVEAKELVESFAGSAKTTVDTRSKPAVRTTRSVVESQQQPPKEESLEDVAARLTRPTM